MGQRASMMAEFTSRQEPTNKRKSIQIRLKVVTNKSISKIRLKVVTTKSQKKTKRMKNNACNKTADLLQI